jgi:hypothetical protein
MTTKQRVALDHLRRSQSAGADVPHGTTTTAETFYDIEIDCAYIHWRTAAALERRGLVRFGDWDPEYGTDLWLTEATRQEGAA